MSVGNAPLTIDYNQAKSVLVTATNGSGKSSIMLDSLTFALYGKPYRNINIPQTVNSINQKCLEVELTFAVNKTKYKIIRGIKPKKFEIYKNGKLLNQEADTRDYQKVLEQTILKMNYQTFTQVVIMGSGNYIPFMRLKASARRDFVEDILDIKIFSVMNSLLKQQIKLHFDNLDKLNTQIEFLKEKVKMQQYFISTMENEKEGKRVQIENEIEKLNAEVDQYWKKIEQFTLGVNSTMIDAEAYEKVASKKVELMNIEKQIRVNIEKQDKDKKKYASMDVCPTCYQEIKDHHRDNLIKRAVSNIAEFEDNLKEINDKIGVFNKQLAIIADSQEKIRRLQVEIGNCNIAIKIANSLISKHQKELHGMSKDNSSIELEKRKMSNFAKEIIAAVEKKKEIKEAESYYDAISKMLKDTGIKTRIIKQYVPVLNSLIKKYLDLMDLFVSFELDENFNETVKSRHRDTFTFESFSAGEQQRISLALLFVFRDIARIKSSINTNILILDEVMDQSLDADGIDGFFNIIRDLKDTNLFVISHRSNIQDKFDKVMKLKKENNFTILDTN